MEPNYDISQTKNHLDWLRGILRGNKLGSEYYKIFPQLEESDATRALEREVFEALEYAVAYAEYRLGFLDPDVSELYGFGEVVQN